MARLVQHKDFPKGDVTFESNREGIVKQVLDKIPSDLILPTQYIDGPPRNVTTVPRDSGLLNAEELDITENYDLVSLAQAIATKKFTSVQVTSAFARRACIAHQLTFCLTELYILEALQQAKDLDERLARTGNVVGPLHGVPISIKEMVPVKGQLTTLGILVTRHVSGQDCDLVSILRQLGAVFYVKTHQPAAVFSLESVSFLGRTLNPHNLDLAPGGSSGGEGALLAMKGSVFGIGTDIGGSIRVPSAWSGLFGMKGSHGFWPTGKMIGGPFPPALQVDGIIGPMGRTLNDIEYMNKLVRNARPELLDPEILPKPYTGFSTPSVSKDTLKIGILRGYETTRLLPPVQQVITWVEAQLNQAGFRTQPYQFYETAKASLLFNSVMVADGFKGIYEGFEAGKEPYYPNTNGLLQKVIDSVPNAVRGQEETASTIAAKKFARDTYRTEFLQDWIKQGDMDIVIAPMGVAPPHDTASLETTGVYTHLWNLLDWPGIVVPTPFKVGKKAEYEEMAPGQSEYDEEVSKLWRENDYEGAPIGLQIVAKRRMENELMAAVGLIREALKLP